MNIILPEPARFTRREYKRFIHAYPHVAGILQTPFTSEQGEVVPVLQESEKEVMIYVALLSDDQKEQIGTAGLRELKKHIHREHPFPWKIVGIGGILGMIILIGFVITGGLKPLSDLFHPGQRASSPRQEFPAMTPDNNEDTPRPATEATAVPTESQQAAVIPAATSTATQKPTTVPTRTPSPEPPAPTPTMTPRPQPTATPEPTATALPVPTATPIPTKTPVVLPQFSRIGYLHGLPVNTSAGIVCQQSESRQFTSETTLHSGDCYRITFTPKDDAYTYIFQIDATGTAYRVFPLEEFSGVVIRKRNPVRKGRQYVIPAQDKWFILDENTGKETIYVLTFQQRQEQLASDRFAIIAGERLEQRITDDRGNCPHCLDVLTFLHR